MPTNSELGALLLNPNESLSIEHKSWLDLRDSLGKAKLAKAAIALANHGGGLIVLGMRADSAERGPLQSQVRPENIRRYTQDEVNAAINRHAEPQLHCELVFAMHPETSVEHAFVIVPSGMSVPVMSTRDAQGEIASQKCYIRKPGPRSEEPYTAEEWRGLFDRCLRERRADMLNAIRAIVQGQAGAAPTGPEQQAFSEFLNRARVRWETLADELPDGAAGKLPNGHYEVTFELPGIEPISNLTELLRRIDEAHEIKLTGWSAFVRLSRAPLEPKAVGNGIETWLGAPEKDRRFYNPAHVDFWRIEPNGRFFLLRGYDEDSTTEYAPGIAFDVTLPIWRVGEAMLFVSRFASIYGNEVSIVTRCRYTGLRGRKLVSLDRRRMLFDERQSSDGEVTVEIQATVAEVRDNLVEILRRLLAPLYERFAFFELSAKLVSDELQRLTSSRF